MQVVARHSKLLEAAVPGLVDSLAAALPPVDGGNRRFGTTFARDFLDIVISNDDVSQRNARVASLAQRASKKHVGASWLRVAVTKIADLLIQTAHERLVADPEEQSALTQAISTLVLSDGMALLASHQPSTSGSTGPGQTFPDDWVTVAKNVETALSAVVDPFEVMEEIAEQLRKVIPFDRFELSTFNSTTNRFGKRYFTGTRIPDDDGEFGFPPGFVESALQGADHFLFTSDEFAPTPDEPSAVSQFRDVGVRQILVFPLRDKGEIRGVLSFFTLPPNNLNAEHVEFTRFLAAKFAESLTVGGLADNLQIQLEHSSALADLARDLASHSSIDELLKKSLSRIRDVLLADRISVFAQGEERGDIHMVAAEGTGAPEVNPDLYGVPVTILDAVMPDGRSRIFTREDLQYFRERVPMAGLVMDASDLNTFLIVPLSWRGKTIGGVFASSRARNAFSREHRSLIDHAASIVSGAVGISLLNIQLEEEATRRGLLLDISRIVSAGLEPEEAFDGLAETIRRAIGFDRIAVGMFNADEDVLRYAYVSGYKAENYSIGHRAPVDHRVLDSDVDSGGLLIEDAEAERKNGETERYLSEIGMRSVISVPLSWDGKASGVITVSSRQPNSYRHRDLSMLREVSRVISPSVENLKLFEAAQQQWRETEALSELSRIIGDTLETGEMWEKIADTSRRLIVCDRFAISSIDVESGIITDVYSVGGGDRAVRSGHSRPLAQTLVTKLEPGSPAIIFDEDALKAEPDQASALALDLKSLLICPLSWDGRMIGTLNFRSSMPNGFTERDSRVATRIALQIAGAIARAQQHQETVEQVREEQLLSKIGRITSSAGTIPEIYEQFSDAVKELIHYDRLVITEIDVASNKVIDANVAGLQLPGYPAGRTAHVDGSFLLALLPDTTPRTWGEADLLASYSSTAKPPIPSSRSMLAAGLRSLMTCPIWWRNELIGTLQFRSCSPERYSERELKLSARIAQVLAGSIGISRANQNLQVESGIRQTLAEVSRVITQGGMSSDSFDQFLTLLKRHISIDTGFINYVEEDTGMLTNLWVGGEPLPGTYTGSTMRFAGRLTEQAILAKEPVVVDMTDPVDFASWSESLDVSARLGIKSILALPLIANGRVVGTLQFRTRQPGAYTDDKLQFLRLITDQISGEIAMFKLQRQLERRTEERELLADLSRILSTETPGLENLTPFAERLTKSIKFDGMRVNFVDQDAGTITNTFQYRSVPNPGETVVPLQGTFTQYVVKENRTLHVGIDPEGYVPGWHRRLAGGLRAIIVTPLRQQGRVVATMHLYTGDAGIFDGYVEALAERVGDQVAGHITAIELNKQRQAQASERELLADISRILSSPDSAEDAFSAFSERLSDVIDFDGVRINLVDHKNGLLSYRHYSGPIGKPRADTLDLSGTFTEHLLKQDRVLNLTADKDGIFPGWNDSGTAGVYSVLAAPLRWHGIGIGAFQLLAVRPHAFTSAHEALVEKIADQVVGVFVHEAQVASELMLERERATRAEVEAKNIGLQHAAKSRELFLSMVSHELKTPLTAIFSFANILARNTTDNLSERQMQQLRVIQRNSILLNLLINDLLDGTRLETGSFSVVYSDSTLDSLVDEVVQTMTPITTEKNQKLTVINSAGSQTISVDRTRVVQALCNLVSNASKYSNRDTEITVESWISGGKCHIEIRDSGIGMSEQDLAMIMNPFVRVDSEYVRNVSGTGLGLYIVKSVVDAHGGEISLTSASGEGTVAHIWIPTEHAESHG